MALVTLCALAGVAALGCGRVCNGFAEEDAVRVARRHKLRNPRCCAADGLSSEWMHAAVKSNYSLLRYFYPAEPQRAWQSGALARSFRPVTRGCRIVPAACYCIHVTGSPVKAENAFGWRKDGLAAAKFSRRWLIGSAARSTAKYASFAISQFLC